MSHKTLLDVGRSHNFATAFLRNLAPLQRSDEYQCMGVLDC